MTLSVNGQVAGAGGSVAAGDITDVGATGEALVQAETAAEGRTALALDPREDGVSVAPLLWWKADETDPATVTLANSGSVSSASLTLTNSVAGALGPWGDAAVQMATNGYGVCPVNKAQPTPALSICLWFRQLGLANARLMMRSYGPTWSAPYTSADLFIDNAGKLVGGIAGGGAERRLSASSVLVVARAAEWHHAALTFDGTVGIVYLDGREVGRFSYTGTVDYDDPSLTRWCVAGNNLTPESLDGDWADARVYAAALSAAKVAEIHRRGRGVGAP